MQVQNLDFHFKSNREIKIADDAIEGFKAAGWKPATKDDKIIGWKRPSISAVLPALEDSDIINILDAGGAGVQFLLAVANEQFYLSARSKIADIISANPLAAVTADTIAGFNLAWDGMAADFLTALNETRSTGIAKEVWDDFEADYISVMMQQMPGNGEEKIKNAAAHLKARFQKCRSNKVMVKKLQDYLAVWFAASANQEEFAKVFEALNNRAEVLLNASDEDSI